MTYSALPTVRCRTKEKRSRVINPDFFTLVPIVGKMCEIEGRAGKISDELRAEYREAFDSIDVNRNGVIDKDEIGQLLEAIQVKIPGYKLRSLKDEYGDTVDFEEFIEIVLTHSDTHTGSQFLDMLTKKNVEHIGGISEGSAEGTTHSFSEAETAAFADWINSQLAEDAELKDGGYIPIDSSNNYKELFQKVRDGVLLCKMINATVANTIDERAVNKKNLKVFTIHENQTLVINSAASIGCHITNIGPEDLANGKVHLVLGLLWQVIRIGLFSKITLPNVPGLQRLLLEGEDISDLHKLSPEELLLRWVNYQLEAAGCERRITNFSEDISDSVVYSYLLSQIAPPGSGVDKPNTYNSIRDPLKKAGKVLDNANRLGCRKFVRDRDIVEGNQKLNMAFVANLFNTYPCLPPMDVEESKTQVEDENLYREETREEQTYRNWMNSLGVDPFVTWLYTDLYDGQVLFQLYDSIKTGMVDWDRVCTREDCKKLGGNMKKIQNCNYCLELGKSLNFTLVGIGGQDINAGNEVLTLGLVWQMMRAYTYSILTKLAPEGSPRLKDNDIIEWVQEQLAKGKKSSTIKSFKDPSICTSLAVIDLIDCISSKVVNYNLVTPGETDEEKLLNARYALSLARKIGAQIYALPEDLVEVKPKMVLTVFACLMACAYKNTKQKESKKKQVKK
ncbi:plastin-2-like [Actinia tenebrosa]|uniref:Fimbrin n=1 Tax=Actinia tenebrosa TaxID=6105 RepID=A0A6P8J2J9_ACTTE|nr:plastin-2-like [Actinia tenebrosa]